MKIFVNRVEIVNAVGWFHNPVSGNVLCIDHNDQVVASFPDCPETHLFKGDKLPDEPVVEGDPVPPSTESVA